MPVMQALDEDSPMDLDYRTIEMDIVRGSGGNDDADRK
jgi:hypothetical protein